MSVPVTDLRVMDAIIRAARKVRLPLFTGLFDYTERADLAKAVRLRKEKEAKP